MSAHFHLYLCGRIAAEWLIFMKKVLSVLLALLLLLSLTGCAEMMEAFSSLPDMVEDAREQAQSLPVSGSYTSKEDVAKYIYLYGCLPPNFMTKTEARSRGWEGGSLEPYAPGKCIGGDVFGNYEGLLPDASGRTWTECDIDTLGASSRGAKRIVFSNDGLIYYTDDHYESFELLYSHFYGES